MNHRKRVWLFRGLAILLGLVPFAACELVLRAAGLPKRPPAVDPFVDLHNLKPLFVPVEQASQADGEKPVERLDGQSIVLEIAAERLNLFRPASFRVPKPEGVVRIFALGGSTTQGEPYSTETAFPAWLGLGLQTGTVTRKVEVINCGGLSYASYRVLAILKEIVRYEPDLVVIYTGHNEFLERRSYEGYEIGSLGARARSMVAELRTVQYMRNLFGQDGFRSERVVHDPTALSGEVDALLDYQGGLEDYTRADTWREPVVEHFRWNLEKMIETCRDARLPLVLIKPVSNLRDCPPMKFGPDTGLGTSELAEFDAHWENARTATSEEVARREVESALRIDPEHAGANYLAGTLYVRSGEWENAKRALAVAKDQDVCPLRAITPIVSVVEELANARSVPLVDADALFSSESEGGIVGDRWLVDHIHPSVEGHQMLGTAIAERCLEEGLFDFDRPEFAAGQSGLAKWRERLPGVFSEHMAGLGEEYFHRGKQRLEGLLLWTQGRAKKVRDTAGP